MAARKWEILFIIYTHNGAASASRAPERRGVGEIGAPPPLPPALGCIVGYRRVISKKGEGASRCRMSTGRHIPPPLAGVGTGGRNDRAREGEIPRPRLRGRGLRAKRAGGGGIQLQDVYGQAYNLFFFE